MSETLPSGPFVYQLRVVLRGISPLIWRRILPADHRSGRPSARSPGSCRSVRPPELLEAEEVAASLRFATVAITKAAKAGASDEAQDQNEEVPV